MPPNSRRGDDYDYDSGSWYSVEANKLSSEATIASEIMSIALAGPTTATLSFDGSTLLVTNPGFPVQTPTPTPTTASTEAANPESDSAAAGSSWLPDWTTSTADLGLTGPTFTDLMTSPTTVPYGQSTAAADSTGTASSSSNNGSTSSSGAAISNNSDSHSGPSTGMITAAVIIPVSVILALVFAGFLIHRRRKAQHEEQQERALEEMKMRGRHDLGGAGGVPVAGSQSPSPSYQSSPYQDSGSSQPRAHTSPASAAPIIIAPMESNNGAYFTGIDTSEALSVRSSEREGSGGFMLDGEHHEEPPPPYRPASVPALSRDSSVRQPARPGNASSSSSHLMADSPDSAMRSPFADPAEEEAMSDVSTPTGTYEYARRPDDDELSFVSEMSYQDGPTRIHQTV